MMKKDWYIFQGTQHRGPFSVDELASMFREGNLKRETLIWKEGVSEWEPIFKVPEYAFLFHEMPTTPPVPAMDISLPTGPKLEMPDLPPDLPPPMPALGAQKKSGSSTNHKKNLTPAPIAFKDPTRLDLPPVPELTEMLKENEVKGKNLARYKWIVVLVFVFLVGLGVYLGLQSYMNVPKSLYIRGINPSNLSRLEDVVQRNFNGDDVSIAAEFALTVDGKEIWMASNFNGSALLQVTLESVPDRVLGKAEVIIESRARLADHQARFNKIRLIKGEEFLPGEYTYKLKGKKIHPLNDLVPTLQKIEMFRKLNADFVVTGKTIIFSGTKNDFEYKLIDYKKEIINNSIKPLEEKLEKLTTLRGIILKTNESFLEVFKKSNPKPEMKSFEEFFIREVSPMLQTIVSDSIALNENEIVQTCKTFGETATGIISYVNGQKIWNAKTNKPFVDTELKKLDSQAFYLEIQQKRFEGEIRRAREKIN